MFDWNHFFGSIRKYLDYYRAHIQTMPLMNGSTATMQIISDSELAGLLSWIKFATTISQNVRLNLFLKIIINIIFAECGISKENL